MGGSVRFFHDVQLRCIFWKKRPQPPKNGAPLVMTVRPGPFVNLVLLLVWSLCDPCGGVEKVRGPGLLRPWAP